MEGAAHLVKELHCRVTAKGPKSGFDISYICKIKVGEQRKALSVTGQVLHDCQQLDAWINSYVQGMRMERVIICWHGFIADKFLDDCLM